MTILTKNQLDESLRAVLASMEEGKEYILTKEAWEDYQKTRESFGWSRLDDEYRKTYSFKVQDNQLLLDSRYNHVIIKDISQGEQAAVAAVAVAMTVTWSATATVIVTALITNRIELKEKSCKSLDGKIAEIDGKKYELKEVK